MKLWHRLRHELIKERHRKQRWEAAHTLGVDVSWGRPDPDALLNQHREFICLYVSKIKGLAVNQHDIHRYSRKGLAIVLLFEAAQEGPRGGIRAGRRDGKLVLHLVRELKLMPKGRPVMFAVDFEATGPEVAGYFRGINEVLHGTEVTVGCYGSRTVVSYLLDNGLLDFAMQTYAWSHHLWDVRAGLRQVLIDLPTDPLQIDGVAVDYCRSMHMDFGQWRIDHVPNDRPILPPGMGHREAEIRGAFLPR